MSMIPSTSLDRDVLWSGVHVRSVKTSEGFIIVETMNPSGAWVRIQLDVSEHLERSGGHFDDIFEDFIRLTEELPRIKAEAGREARDKVLAALETRARHMILASAMWNGRPPSPEDDVERDTFKKAGERILNWVSELRAEPL